MASLEEFPWQGLLGLVEMVANRYENKEIHVKCVWIKNEKKLFKQKLQSILRPDLFANFLNLQR